MSVLSLQNSIIYGPVRSRRLGASLGVNLLPRARKFCSFDCLYCQYGWTERHGLDLSERNDLPSLDDVRRAVETALARDHALDYITLAGNGEPTLHPKFAEIVDVVNALRDRHAVGVKTAILSNSSTIGRWEIREAVGRLDEPIMKLDAGTETGWRRFNRPCRGVQWEELIAGLEALEGPVLQSLFAHGENGNTSPEEIMAWIGLVGRIRPRSVQVYTLDRPAPERSLEPVAVSQLEDIARQAKEGAGVPVSVY